MGNPQDNIQRTNIIPDIISVGDDNWNVEKTRTWLIENAERDQLTGSIIPGQAYRHPDGAIMTVCSPIEGMRVFTLCSYCYRAGKASSMERHVKNCRVHLDGASTAINNNINRDHVIIDPSSPPPLNIEPSSSSPPVAAPGESSVDNPEPSLTVISRGERKKRGTKSNDEEEKRTSDANEVRGGIKSGVTISLLGSSQSSEESPPPRTTKRCGGGDGGGKGEWKGGGKKTKLNSLSS